MCFVGNDDTESQAGQNIGFEPQVPKSIVTFLVKTRRI